METLLAPNVDNIGKIFYAFKISHLLGRETNAYIQPSQESAQIFNKYDGIQS